MYTSQFFVFVNRRGQERKGQEQRCGRIVDAALRRYLNKKVNGHSIHGRNEVGMLLIRGVAPGSFCFPAVRVFNYVDFHAGPSSKEALRHRLGTTTSISLG